MVVVLHADIFNTEVLVALRSAAVLLPARCGAHRGEKVSRAAWLL